VLLAVLEADDGTGVGAPGIGKSATEAYLTAAQGG
jgi:hypothetical protein